MIEVDMAGIPRSAKRFSALPLMGTEEINHIQEPDLVPGKDYKYSDKWVIGVDSRCRTEQDESLDHPLDGEDEGSVYLPMSRVALRDSNGLIPSSMLPSYVDDMMFGTLVVDTTAGKATFTDSESSKVYSSPESKRATGELEPLANVIYVNTDNNFQYRYIKAQETEESVNYGFAELQGSRALTGGYGIEVTQDQGANELIISAKTPDFVKTLAPSSQASINPQQAVIPLPAASSISSSNITLASQGNTTQIGGLDSSRKYMFNMRLGVVPSTLSGNIIDVYFKLINDSDVSNVVKTVDMSGPAGTKTVLDYSFLLCPKGTSVSMSLSAEELLLTTTEDFSLVELI